MKRVRVHRFEPAAENYLIGKELIHQHVVNVHDVKRFRDALWIVMEYCDLGDLGMFFKHYNETVMETSVKVKLMKQIISGVAFLHSKDIVQRHQAYQHPSEIDTWKACHCQT